MLPSRLAALIGGALLLAPATGRAQGTKADYERAAALPGRTGDKVFKSGVRPHWFAANTRFWYVNHLADGTREFVVVDAPRGERRPAFDRAKVAAALARVDREPREPRQLTFRAIAMTADGSIRFAARGKEWRYDPQTDIASEESGLPGPLDDDSPFEIPLQGEESKAPDSATARTETPRSEVSPDGKLEALVRDHNIRLRERGTSGESWTLSTEGTESDGYEPNVFWSPDSKRFLALRTARGDDRKVWLIESTPKDQLQPKIDSVDYLKPGDRLPVTKPHLFDVGSRAEIRVDDARFANPWSIDQFRWSPDSRRFTFVFNQRGHQVLRLISVDAATGAASALIEETSRTFVDYSNKTYLHFVDQRDEILWMSERDGWNHLYLIDARTGAIKSRVTRGEWVVFDVEGVDESARQIWFRAGGLRAGQDPYHVHFARVNFDGSGLTLLTEGDGTHKLKASSDWKYFIDTYSRVDLPPITEVRDGVDGHRLCELERADWSALLATGWKVPERFVAKGRDGKTDIYGVIFRPTNFDPEKKYPVIEQIYAGPHGAHVPKAFEPFHGPQALAELGFIVVQIDGMGTNWRSKAFHDVCWKNLADAGFPDRIPWLKAAAEKYPQLDLTRVGIYGGSAGGQNALGALLFHGDFYKAAAADCGCHDNRMDKIWWNEAWMGWPIGPHYAEQSNATNAHMLRGKLLLTVGELDHNVDPASTMQVVDALIKADKDFELIVFPGKDHGAGGSPYGTRRRNDFFVRTLLGVEPRRP